MTGPDHSLSVAALLAASSPSPALLRPADPETRLRVEELALASFSFSFSWKSMKIRDRASLYAASRSSIVGCLLVLLVALLRPPTLPVSEGSRSETSASSPATEPGCEFCRVRRSKGSLRMILIAGWADSSTGTSSDNLRTGLGEGGDQM